MNRGGRAARSSAAQSLGAADPRLRRNAQAGATDNDLGTGLELDPKGRVSVALDVAGALYVRPDGTIGLRLGDGLTLAAGSPVAVRLVEADGTVQVTSKGLRARVTASQVTTANGITVEADLAAKQDLSEKGVAGGYAGIESTGYVDINKLGSLGSGAGTKALHDDGKFKVPGGSSATWTETEIDLGSAPVAGAAFTVVDASVSGTSKIVVVPSGSAPTGGYADVWEWDALMFAATPGTGQFTLHATVAGGTTNGKRKILYQVS